MSDPVPYDAMRFNFYLWAMIADITALIFHLCH